MRYRRFIYNESHQNLTIWAYWWWTEAIRSKNRAFGDYGWLL